MRRNHPILVVIPYLPGAGQGRELEYAVKGWQRHFKEDHRVVIVGEGVTACAPEGTIPVESPRVAEIPGQYRQHLDYVSCFRRVRELFPDSDGYIRVGDDCYAVHDFDMSDVMVRKTIGEVGKNSVAVPMTWQGDKQRTRAVLEDAGCTTHNYTTHLPQFFEWDKMAALWERFGMERTSYVDEDLYYNIYEGDRVAVNVHEDPQPYKCGIYRANPRIDYIEASFGTRLWITNSPEGWVPQLDMMLDSYYNGADTWAWKERPAE
jgi:hypothetical protein